MTALRVMTWNVENLFLLGDNGGTDSPAVFEHKLRLLAAVIDQETPDVLALQEIGSDGALSALPDRLDHKMPNRALGGPDRRGIRVAVLPTRPLTSTSRLRNLAHHRRQDVAFHPTHRPATTFCGNDHTGAAGEDALGTPVTQQPPREPPRATTPRQGFWTQPKYGAAPCSAP